MGYDALVALKFESERRAFPERFNNQLKNQMMYVKHGFTEFFKPSSPLNGNVTVHIAGEEVELPDNCRSLKLININSAMNGLFFWGSGKSRTDEYQGTKPRMDDGKLELMGTRGVHDMIQYRVNVSHAHRIAQPNDVTISITKSAIALQIDGEAWIIQPGCSFRVQFHDKLPIVIGYNNPRGVESWLQASLNDAHIVRAKESFRKRLKLKYAFNDDEEDLMNSTQSAPAVHESPTTSSLSPYQPSSTSLNNSFSISSLFGGWRKKAPEMNEMKSGMDDVEMIEGTNTSGDESETVDFVGEPMTTNANANILTFFGSLFQPSKVKSDDSTPAIAMIDEGNEQKTNAIEYDAEESELQAIDEIMKSIAPINDGSDPLSEIAHDSKKHFIDEYLKQYPSTILDEHNSKLILDKFAWWKIMRAKNKGYCIDTEIAQIAIEKSEINSFPRKQKKIRKTQSLSAIPNQFSI